MLYLQEQRRVASICSPASDLIPLSRWALAGAMDFGIRQGSEALGKFPLAVSLSFLIYQMGAIRIFGNCLPRLILKKDWNETNRDVMAC